MGARSDNMGVSRSPIFPVGSRCSENRGELPANVSRKPCSVTSRRLARLHPVLKALLRLRDSSRLMRQKRWSDPLPRRSQLRFQPGQRRECCRIHSMPGIWPCWDHCERWVPPRGSVACSTTDSLNAEGARAKTQWNPIVGALLCTLASRR